MKEKFNKISTWLGRRGGLIVLVAIVEICIYLMLSKFNSGFEFLHNQETWIAILKGNGIWTLIILVISAPIAFLIWKFRDENTIQQLENQRKDVNLKEFHKIAEWVSGLHLIEDKITEKHKYSVPTEGQDYKELSEKERIREFNQVGEQQHLPSFSRRDGAVGLQIAAIHMLRPFYCGHHGEAFRKPALNLLTGAWLALFKPAEDSDEEQGQLANSRLAIALTEAIFADGGIHLVRHPEVLPNLYLPHVDLHLPGLGKEVLQVFRQQHNCQGICLNYANLSSVDFSEANLNGAQLSKAKLSNSLLSKSQLAYAMLNKSDLNGADLNGADLNGADLNGANLNKAGLNKADLGEAELNGANLKEADLNEAILWMANLNGANLNKANLNKANLGEAELNGANLNGADLNKADLGEAKLNGANLFKATLTDVSFSNVILNGALIDEENFQNHHELLQREEELIIVIENKKYKDSDTEYQEWRCVSRATGKEYQFRNRGDMDLSATQVRNQNYWEIEKADIL